MKVRGSSDRARVELDRAFGRTGQLSEGAWLNISLEGRRRKIMLWLTEKKGARRIQRNLIKKPKVKVEGCDKELSHVFEA